MAFCQTYAIHASINGKWVPFCARAAGAQGPQQGVPRTTKTCEAWHRRFGTLVGKLYPSLYVFLDQLQEEIAEVDVQITRRRSALEAAEARINRVVERYETFSQQDDGLTYLRAIGHNLGGRF